MNFMLAIAVEHHATTSANGHSQSNWKSVLEIANEIFQHIPDFANKFPQGLSDHSKLRSQWNDRTRARNNNKTLHRRTAWVLNRDLCSTKEIARMAPLADTVINAERVLSQKPGSSVRDPGPNALRWTQYDVKAATARPIKRDLEVSSGAENDFDLKAKRQRKGARTAAVEEKKDPDGESRESSSSLAPAPIARRRRTAGTQEGGSRADAASDRGNRGGARLVQQFVDDRSAGVEGVQDDGAAQPGPKLGIARCRKAKNIIVAQEDDNVEAGVASSLVSTPQLGRRRANETWPEAKRRHKAEAGSVARGDRLVEQFPDDSVPGYLVDALTPVGSATSISLTHSGGSFLGPADHSITFTMADTTFQATIGPENCIGSAAKPFGAIILELNAGPWIRTRK